MSAPEPTDERTRHTAARPSGTPPSGDTGPPAPEPTGAWRPPVSRAAVPEPIGRYDIRAVLGEGAFGRVYRAFDPDLGREVAVKVPHPQGLTAEARERFLREARAAAKVHHPNVCPIYDVGTDGDVPYIVMRFVPGGTLADLLGRRILPSREAVTLARQLALGVAAAHAQGVVHRDLKPGNALWDAAARQVLVTDFGLARVGGEAAITGTGAVLGTPAYMAPEQARGDTAAVGPLSDVYALGVILYRMLAGVAPYTGTVYEVMLRACEGNPPPPSAVNPASDPTLDAVCLRAMAVAPADRFPTAKALADVLGAYIVRRAGMGTGTDPAVPLAARPSVPSAPSVPPAPSPTPCPAESSNPWAGVAPEPVEPEAPPPSSRARKRRARQARNRMLMLGGVCLASVVVIVGSVQLIGRAREERAARLAPDSLKQVVVGLQLYHNVHRGYPPAGLPGPDGNPLLSWRVAVLPFVGEEALYKQFKLDEPWDGPTNKKLLARMPKVFQGSLPTNDGKTAFKVLVGNGAAFDPRRSRRFTDIPDGLADTLGVVESAPPVDWTKPEDIPFDGKTAPRLNPVDSGDLALTATLDATVRRLSLTLNPPDVILKATTAAGGETYQFK